jgi:hypothetical protein
MTMPPTGPGQQRQDDLRLEARRAATTRDAGLRRVARLTGWTVAVAIGLTGALSEVAAHALPGRAKHAAPSPSRSLPRPSAPTSAPAVPQTSAAPAPQPPAEAPAPSDAGGGAVSGGS